MLPARIFKKAGDCKKKYYRRKKDMYRFVPVVKPSIYKLIKNQIKYIVASVNPT
jgi:hypothetical protein